MTARHVSRRRFLALAGCLAGASSWSQSAENIHFNVAAYDHDRILAAADDAMQHPPVTITSMPAPIPDLDKRTYYSENVEWFPTADGKGYEYRPGRINDKAFSKHRDALVAMNGCVAACVAAWKLTQDRKYADHALRHLQAWFVDEATSMLPLLDHGACTSPSSTGTYLAVEDTVMLAETFRAASFLCAYNGLATEQQTAGLHAWCAAFLTWLNQSKPGFIAREMKDHTAICWTLQAAELARFTRNSALQLECSHRFRDKLLRQMNFDGQFPIELHWPDAYAASIFTLDCLSVTCEVLSTPLDSLWNTNLPDGRGMRSAIAFLYPALENRGAWRLPADAEHFTDWPVRQPSLLLAGRAYSRPEYLALWKRLPAEPRKPELLRYMPVRQPALWTVRPPA